MSAEQSKVSIKWIPGGWRSGVRYSRNDMLRDGAWTMISLVNDNFDRAAPQPEGVSSFAMDSAALAQNTDLGYVETANDFTFSKGGIIDAVRWDIPVISDDYLYQLILGKVEDGEFILITSVTLPPAVSAPGWVDLDGELLVFAGDTYRVAMITQNQLGLVPKLDGPWVYDGIHNNNDPLQGQWNTSNDGTTLRISDTTDDSQNVSADLASITIGDTIVMTGPDGSAWTYRVNQPSFYSQQVVTFPSVLRISATGSIGEGDLCDVFAYGDGTADTVYTVDAGYWDSNQPSWGQATGLLLLTAGAEPQVSSDAYGCDVRFQPASISQNWAMVSISAGMESLPAAAQATAATTTLTPKEIAWVKRRANRGGG